MTCRYCKIGYVFYFKKYSNGRQYEAAADCARCNQGVIGVSILQVVGSKGWEEYCDSIDATINTNKRRYLIVDWPDN